MVKIRNIKSKSIITPSNLECDYVINPYIGCSHGCIYCYARFMKRFTGHKEKWGSFVDAKINAPDLIKNIEKYKDKSIYFSSVTDPYQPLEVKYKITRRVLERIVSAQLNIIIQTKSALIVRDIDLFKQFNNILVGISLSTLNDNIRKKIEPRASTVDGRITALKKLKKARLKTYVFISPILPSITGWREIINRTKKYTDEFWFENLNLYLNIRSNIYKFLNKINPKLVDKYKEIYLNKGNYWINEEKAIKDFCKKNKIKYKIYFHHKLYPIII